MMASETAGCSEVSAQYVASHLKNGYLHIHCH